MDNQIDPAVQERIRALCGQITVAHDLDPEIQEELYGHMEDKLLAYLAGEEKLSPEDAFILVREHFGNPEALKEVLRSVHAPGHHTETRVSLPRRLTAALAVSMIVGIPIGLAWSLAQFSLALWSVQTGSLATVATVRLFAMIVLAAAGLFPVWKTLLRWQRELAQGKKPWFARWPARWMWAAFGAALLVPSLIPQVYLSLTYMQQHFPAGRPAEVMSVLAVMVTLQAVNTMVWLWWVDHTPRTRGRLQWTLVSLVALEMFWFLCPRAVPGLLISTGEVPGIPKPSLVSGALLDGNIHWSLTWARGEFWSSPGTNGDPSHLLATIGSQFIALVGVMLLGYGAYILARRIQRRKTHRPTPGRAIA